MKKFTTLAFILIMSFSFTGIASAYGGGPTFPPGYEVKLKCHKKVINLPFNRTISVPKCEIEKDKDFKKRLREFIDRVVHGKKAN